MTKAEVITEAAPHYGEDYDSMVASWTNEDTMSQIFHAIQQGYLDNKAADIVRALMERRAHLAEFGVVPALKTMNRPTPKVTNPTPKLVAVDRMTLSNGDPKAFIEYNNIFYLKAGLIGMEFTFDERRARTGLEGVRARIQGWSKSVATVYFLDRPHKKGPALNAFNSRSTMYMKHELVAPYLFS